MSIGEAEAARETAPQGSSQPGTLQHRIRLRVNARDQEVEVRARTTLADCLRQQLQLTGTKIGCEQGVCGACTVLVDGRSVRSCLMLAVQADGAEVVTVEGLAAPDGPLSDLQEAFARHDALQCGFCTAGILMTASEVLADATDPMFGGQVEDLDEPAVAEALSGNLCRCTGYTGIVDAVMDTWRARHGGGHCRTDGRDRPADVPGEGPVAHGSS